ncbi:MAG TPA: ammonium transporter, partial [Gammaproteobacteria bacterium]|nr:ammonium transporter [Gammaproteobacteria bacterium]
MENQIFELQYAIDTFYFLVMGAFVMWMAAGFSMLESGLVRAKNTTEILTKNVALYAVACTMYMVCGYHIMYGGGWFLSGIETVANLDVGAALAASAENGFDGDSVYSGASDFFFQVVFVATAMSIVSGAVAERMKLWAFIIFAVVMTGLIYPMEGGWTWGGNSVFGIYDLSYSDYAGSGIVHLAGATAALAGVLLLGPRKGKYSADGKSHALPGANLPLATLGTFILWMG